MKRCEAGEVGGAAPLCFADKLLVLGAHQLARDAERHGEREQWDEGEHGVLVVEHLALTRIGRSARLPSNYVVAHSNRHRLR